MVLTQLNPGQSARILNMQFLEKDTRRRLFALGILPHTCIHCLRRGPFNGPLQCRCAGQTLAFSTDIANTIEVELV